MTNFQINYLKKKKIIIVLSSKFYLALFLEANVMMCQHWFRKWLDINNTDVISMAQYKTVVSPPVKHWRYQSLQQAMDTSITLWFTFLATRAPSQYKDHLLGMGISMLTLWGRVTHICVTKLNIIGSDNGLLPGRRIKPLSEPMLEYF